MELQLPFIRRILAEHPNAEYHVWDLARNDDDHHYLQTIKGERITVRTDFYGYPGYDKVYRHYTQPQYQDCLFVKLDDDIVFLETARFGAFVAAIDVYRGWIMSANVVNNGANTPLEPELWEKFTTLNMHLLDVHKSNAYADIAHTHFFAHSTEMLNQPIELVPTEDWLSINAIGYDWAIACRMAKIIGTTRPHVEWIAGRRLSSNQPFGDETVGNTRPRVIMRGFTAGHLGFGPQDVTDEQEVAWRERYAEIGRHYLASEPSECDELPGLSTVSHAQADARARRAATAAGQWPANDWRVRWA